MKILKKRAAILGMVLIPMLLAGCNTGNSKIDPFDYVELGQYKGLDVTKQVHEVTEEELNDEIKTLLAEYGSSETLYEGTVEDGDVANIDYEGKKDGVPFDGGTAQGYDLGIGTGTFIDGFEAGLVGVTIGDTVDLPLTFPENYGNASLAGVDVIFTVTVNYVTRTVLPELTDDFIEEISAGQYKDITSYKEALTKQIISEYEEMNELQYYEDLWNAAVANATIIKDIPTDMINDNVSRLVLNAEEYAKNYGMSFSDFTEQYMGVSKDEFYSQSVEYAELAAKEELVLKAIAEKEGIAVTDEEMDKAIDEYIALGAYASKEEFEARNDKDALYNYVLTSKVEDFLAENAAASSNTAK